jgi:hypothetical protein
MLPVPMVRELYTGQWSMLDYIPPQMLNAAWATSLVAIGLFVAGVGGRLIAIAATVATLSFFTRAPQLIGEFEHILVMLMIYLCVGRCGDAFSVASLWKRDAGTEASPLNRISLRLVQVHLAVIHLMMGWAQLSAPENAWWSGEGVWLAAARPGMSLVDLSGLAAHPRVVAAWSHAITLYLLAMPVFVWKRLSRPLVLTVGALVWISFAVASGWTPFCLAMLTGLAAFVEPRGEAPKLRSE